MRRRLGRFYRAPSAEPGRRSERYGMATRLLLRGFAAGFVGVAGMTATEKVEQTVTGRPNSFVPAHTLERIANRPHRSDEERQWMNWAMHWGQRIALGAARELMA